jgi:transcriptional regulator with XRE-family HTH domain
MIADRIRLARRKAGLSLRDLAAAMDHKVTAQAIGIRTWRGHPEFGRAHVPR